jgi:peptide/nickel transport system permease protein
VWIVTATRPPGSSDGCTSPAPSIGLVAGLSFLGFGLQPPNADWGLMINENRVSITVQPWGVVLPVIAIALLTIGTNLMADGIARAAIGLDRSES